VIRGDEKGGDRLGGEVVQDAVERAGAGPDTMAFSRHENKYLGRQGEGLNG